MKKVLALMLASVMVLSLAACGGAAASTEAPAAPAAEEKAEVKAEAPEEGKVVTLKLASHDAAVEGNSYRVRYEKDIQDSAAAAIDWGFDVQYNSFVSNWDPTTESQQLQNSINEGYDIILTNPCAATGLDPIIEKAQDAGIVYINCDCEYISPDVEILNICTDQYYLGYTTAKYAGEVLGKGAKVLVMAAQEGNAADTQRQQGVRDAMEEYDLVEVGYYTNDWDTTVAMQQVTEFLGTGTEFDGIISSQSAAACYQAHLNTNTPLPKFIGFEDGGTWMKEMYELNKDEVVMHYNVVSNPPGVGGSALNFGLNQILGRELKDGVYSNEEYHSIYLMPRVEFTDQNQEDYKDIIENTADSDVISYWLTIDEVAEEFFK